MLEVSPDILGSREDFRKLHVMHDYQSDRSGSRPHFLRGCRDIWPVVDIKHCLLPEVQSQLLLL